MNKHLSFFNYDPSSNFDVTTRMELSTQFREMPGGFCSYWELHSTSYKTFFKYQSSTEVYIKTELEIGTCTALQIKPKKICRLTHKL